MYGNESIPFVIKKDFPRRKRQPTNNILGTYLEDTKRGLELVLTHIIFNSEERVSQSQKKKTSKKLTYISLEKITGRPLHLQ